MFSWVIEKQQRAVIGETTSRPTNKLSLKDSDINISKRKKIIPTISIGFAISM